VIAAWFRFLKGLRRQPEDSAWFRFWVAVNVTVALTSTAQNLDWPAFFAPCLGLTLGGMLISHRLRHRNNWEVKAALSIFMVLALANFFYGLAHSFFDPREPLAQLLMWLQALHSCDLPARKDLSYSLLSALILMAISAVLSVSHTYAFYLAAYYVSAVIALHYNVASLVAERTGWRAIRQPHSSESTSALGALRLSLTILGSGLVVVMLMPRIEGFKIRALPVSWQMRQSMPSVSKGEVRNPYYPSQLSKEEMRKRSAFNPNGYAGFNSLVDLQTRGRLDHIRVFQVRTNVACYFRGLTFDSYDGQFWSQSESAMRTLNVENPPFSFSPTASNSTDVVQIFYIDRPLANLVLFSPEAYQVFFPSQTLYLDRSGCLRSPFVLDKDIVYSVVSKQAHMTAERLRRLPRRDPQLRQLGRYKRLPSSTPARVSQLAAQIVGPRRGAFEQALALTLYLQSNFGYDLDAPRFPEGVDVVDHFLFEARRGYCEHFASALAILARSRGLATRYCTGFLPGTYNPFTGFREVYGDEAHAWVEIYLPGYGWMTFDPTPGGQTTPELSSANAPEERWLGLSILRYLSQQTGANLRWVGLAAACLGLTLLGVAAIRAIRASKPVDPLARCLEEALTLLAPWQTNDASACLPGQTPRERARQHDLPALHKLVEFHEKVAYSGQPLDRAGLAQAYQWLRQIKNHVRQRRRRPPT